MWAIVPPPRLAAEIDGLRHEFSSAYNAYKALKPPVHLTLFRPFKAPDGQMLLYAEDFGRSIGSCPGFRLTLSGFDFFEGGRSPVVFVNVEPSDPLASLNRRLRRQTESLLELPAGNERFHPHITIGYRDVPAAIFPQIKAAYSRRKFAAAFEVSAVHLFRHNGLQWELIRSMDLRRDAAMLNR